MAIEEYNLFCLGMSGKCHIFLTRNFFSIPLLLTVKYRSLLQNKNNYLYSYLNFLCNTTCIRLGNNQFSANVNPFHYPPPYQPRTLNHPQRSPLNQPQSPPAAHPIPNTTHNTNQNTNQGRNIPAKKPVKSTPISMPYVNLLPYLLNNAMVVITPAKVPQPLFFQGYNSNTTCAYHGGVPGHFIEHCITLKHKVQGLINVGWLKFEEDNRL